MVRKQVQSKRVGKLIIIGGKENRTKSGEILVEVAKLIGKKKLCIVTVASTVGDELWENYREVFKELGIKQMSHLNVFHRNDQVDLEALKAVKGAKAVFFTGGDQLKITSELGGTVVLDQILEIYKKGGILAGTSAGASVMGETMMIAGASDASFKVGTVKMSAGLGLVKNMIIDQHFAERGRIGRLIGATAHNPKFLGVGLDEDTGILFDDPKRFRVLGRGAVYILDAHTSSGCNLSEAEPDSTLSIFGVRMHILVHGDWYDVENRIPYKQTEKKY